MATANDFGVDLMHQIAITASKVGWEPQDIANLAKDENLLRLIRGVVLGTHKVVGIEEGTEHVIDCFAVPFTPEGWKVEEHHKSGKIRLDTSKIKLYFSPKQNTGTIEGNKLREELKGKKVLNANVLDYLLANPKAIPEEWKDKSIFFWGTIYRTSEGRLNVRCLYWCDSKWRSSSDWLSVRWGKNNPAAIYL